MRYIWFWVVMVLLMVSVGFSASDPNERAEDKAPKRAEKVVDKEEAAGEDEKAVEDAEDADEEEVEKGDDAEAVSIPPKGSVNYWTIRSRAMTDLMPFLTKKRKEMKENIVLFADFLVEIGEAEKFAGSEIKVPDDPELYAKALGVYDKMKENEIDIPKKTMSWDETAELAMKFVIIDGYTVVDVDGDEEMSQYKKISEQKEKYAKKVRQELRGYTTKCLKAWLFLGTIDKQAEFRTYAYKQREAAKNARLDRSKKGRAKMHQAERDRRAKQKENNWQSRQSRKNLYYGYYR
jgi:hypothetical protein